MTISFTSQKWLDLLDELLGKEMDLHTFAPCKHVAKMQKLRSKSRAKMINVTFAYQHHRNVNKEANVEFAFPDRSQVFIIFRQICMEQASANPFSRQVNHLITVF